MSFFYHLLCYSKNNAENKASLQSEDELLFLFNGHFPASSSSGSLSPPVVQENPLVISGIWFVMGHMYFLSPTINIKVPKGTLNTTTTWPRPFPFFTHYWTPDRNGTALLMLALPREYPFNQQTNVGLNVSHNHTYPKCLV